MKKLLALELKSFFSAYMYAFSRIKQISGKVGRRNGWMYSVGVIVVGNMKICTELRTKINSMRNKCVVLKFV